MRTQGIEIVEGYLVFAAPQIVPPQFWDRLKHAATRAGVRDEMSADYNRDRAEVMLERKVASWHNARRLAEFEREIVLFRRWVERVIGPQSLWPWQRGWTPELVDAYLEAPAHAEAA